MPRSQVVAREEDQGTPVGSRVVPGGIPPNSHTKTLAQAVTPWVSATPLKSSQLVEDIQELRPGLLRDHSRLTRLDLILSPSCVLLWSALRWLSPASLIGRMCGELWLVLQTQLMVAYSLSHNSDHTRWTLFSSDAPADVEARRMRERFLSTHSQFLVPS